MNGELSRLRWKCRRGMLELDLLLRGFLDTAFETLDATQQQQFDRLLDYPDAVLLEWLLGRIQPADKDVAKLVQQIRSATVP